MRRHARQGARRRVQPDAEGFVVPGVGTLSITFTSAGGGEPINRTVYEFPGGGGAMGMYNLDESIRGFARSSFNFALTRGWPLYLSTKDTILKQYDGRFRDLFQEVYDNEFADEFKKRNLTCSRKTHENRGHAAARQARSGGAGHGGTA